MSDLTRLYFSHLLCTSVSHFFYLFIFSLQQLKLMDLHFTSWENATMWVLTFFFFFTDASLCICSFFLQLCFTSCSCLFFSTEFMFIHSNGGQGWPSIPHPLWPHRIWDNHCRSCCQDSQNTASRGRHGGMCGCHPSTV